MMTETMTAMTGACLKTRLDGLGLAPSWFADRMSVTMRTVVRWFNADEVAVEVAGEIEKLSDLTLDEMRALLAEVPEDGPVVLATYRTDKEFDSEWPASWHRLLTFRVWEHLTASGRDVMIEYR